MTVSKCKNESAKNIYQSAEINWAEFLGMKNYVYAKYYVDTKYYSCESLIYNYVIVIQNCYKQLSYLLSLPKSS